MGCIRSICQKDSYNYINQQKVLLSILPQFSQLGKCYTNDFIIKCHKKLLLHPESFILKYQKSIQSKQPISHQILQKWKLILYGTHIDNQNYIDALGFDKDLEQERIAPSSKVYRFSRQNPFQIRIQDLYDHQSYKQIEKDAGRVFLVPQLKQQLFQKVLKKISNHFPQSGYSLGINYVVAYFLLVGMSQMDSFWMFVHLALNERYLALGLFENQLPLAHLLILIFKNILKRKNRELYEYIYVELQMNDESWILKWIISFYMSILPIQICYYVWDYILTIGSLGISVVAFGLVNYLEQLIYDCEDQVDFSIKIKEMFNPKQFPESKIFKFDIQKFMHDIYAFQFKYTDFDGLIQEQTNKQNFYTNYFSLYAEWKFKNNNESFQQMKQRLSEWYLSISKKRSFFQTVARTSGTKFFISQKPSSQEKTNQFKLQNNTQKQQKPLSKSDLLGNNLLNSPQNKYKDDQLQKITHISLKNIDKIQIPVSVAQNTNRSTGRHKSKARKSKRHIQYDFKSQNYQQKQEDNENRSKELKQSISIEKNNDVELFDLKTKKVESQEVYNIKTEKKNQINSSKDNIRKVKSQNNLRKSKQLHEGLQQNDQKAYSLYKSLNSLKNLSGLTIGQIVFNSGIIKDTKQMEQKKNKQFIQIEVKTQKQNVSMIINQEKQNSNVYSLRQQSLESSKIVQIKNETQYQNKVNQLKLQNDEMIEIGFQKTTDNLLQKISEQKNNDITILMIDQQRMQSNNIQNQAQRQQIDQKTQQRQQDKIQKKWQKMQCLEEIR